MKSLRAIMTHRAACALLLLAGLAGCSGDSATRPRTASTRVPDGAELRGTMRTTLKWASPNGQLNVFNVAPQPFTALFHGGVARVKKSESSKPNSTTQLSGLLLILGGDSINPPPPPVDTFTETYTYVDSAGNNWSVTATELSGVGAITSAITTENGVLAMSIAADWQPVASGYQLMQETVTLPLQSGGDGYVNLDLSQQQVIVLGSPLSRGFRRLGVGAGTLLGSLLLPQQAQARLACWHEWGVYILGAVALRLAWIEWLAAYATGNPIIIAAASVNMAGVSGAYTVALYDLLRCLNPRAYA